MIQIVIGLFCVGFITGFGLGATVAILSRFKNVWGNDFGNIED